MLSECGGYHQSVQLLVEILPIILRKRFDDKKIELLLKLRWWSWDKEKIVENLEKLVFANALATLEKLLEG